MTDEDLAGDASWHFPRRRLLAALPVLATSSSAAAPPVSAQAVATGGSSVGTVTPLAYGADPTGKRDSIAAIERARDEALANGLTLVFPVGTYLMSRPLNLGFARLHTRGEGRTVLRATFSGRAVVAIDSGGDEYLYQGSLRNIVLLGNGSAGQDGLYVRGVVHRHCADIRVRNVGGASFRIESDVLSTYERLVSDRQNDGSVGETQPQYDCVLSGTDTLGATTACTLRDCIFEEGRQVGLLLQRADCNLIEGGTAEGLPGWGVRVEAPCRRNAFSNFYCEANRAGDFDIRGINNHFFNCEAYDPDQQTTSFHLRRGARGNVLERIGALRGDEGLTTVLIDAGAEDNTLRDADLYRLDDKGSGTVLENSRMAGCGRGGSGRGQARGDGTFLPQLAGAQVTGSFGYSGARGEYQRIGNRLHFSLEATVSAVRSRARGDLFVAGLPTAAASDAVAAAVALGPCAGLPVPTDASQVTAAVVGDTVRLYALMPRRGPVPLDAGQVGQTTRLVLSGSYRVG